MQGRTQDISSGDGARLLRECLERASHGSVPEVGDDLGANWMDRPRFGAPSLVAPRLGQGTFCVAVTGAYGRACAITHEHSLPVLEAAHIRPYGREGNHAVSNGLLLRSDIHRLFDKGYVTVTPDYRFEVSDRLKEHFDNGKSYYLLRGQPIGLPERNSDRPDVTALDWHNREVFLG